MLSDDFTETNLRRCRSLDSAVDVVSAGADDSESAAWSVTGPGAVCQQCGASLDRRRPHHGAAGAASALMSSDLTTTGRSSSYGDLLDACSSSRHRLSAGGLCPLHSDDYDASWCSVNNLETDCVSPRVSTNSLFSQLDAVTGASWDNEADQSSTSFPLGGRPPTAGDDDQPMYTRAPRRAPNAAVPSAAVDVPVRFQQPVPSVLVHPLPRQQTANSSGGSTRPGLRGERRVGLGLLPARSISCPSFTARSRQQRSSCPGPPSPVDVPAKRPFEAAVAAAVAVGVTHGSRQARASGDGARAAAPTLGSDGASSDRRCGGLQVAAVMRPSRSASPPASNTNNETSSREKSTTAQPPHNGIGAGVHSTTHDAAGKGGSRSGKIGSSFTGGRTSHNLARTKCLQWLNSFDEDD